MMKETKAKAKNKPVYTKEKARHLVRVYSAIICVALLIAWMQIFLVQPLKEDKFEMVGNDRNQALSLSLSLSLWSNLMLKFSYCLDNISIFSIMLFSSNFKAHMDPSEIIKIPYSLKRLTSFTMAPVVFIMLLWLKNSADRLASRLLSLVKLAALIYGLFGLCGSNIVDNYKHSMTAALYVAALASTTSNGESTSRIVEELPFSDPSDLLAFCRLYGIILTSIPFQTLNVLDAGMQVQRWPLTVLLGATYGYVIGTLVGVTSLYYRRRGKGRKAKQ
jgi:hypothetical protein